MDYIEIGQIITGINDDGEVVEGVGYDELYSLEDGRVVVHIAITVDLHRTGYLRPEQILSVQ